ncbi:hypothetical protein CKO28_23055 [Rhodovibrio sodomensis]|uniref:Uncharacterized protein n=1 Tax=Rhodovibrio sodomensis TaxID=1088 RepID=A0ABS1DMD6_9PROT|nr:hypothetical protein [Rhodovibrio sodomensis]MBK1670894.1 hypothetical protein [Rhodovibrio sodomensis]
MKAETMPRPVPSRPITPPGLPSRPVPSGEQDRLLRLLDTRIALVLASEPQGEQLRRHVRALRARLAVQQLDRRTLNEVAEVVDALAPRRTIDGEPMARRMAATAERTYQRWTRRAAPCAAGLAGLLVWLV